MVITEQVQEKEERNMTRGVDEAKQEAAHKEVSKVREDKAR